MKENKVAIIINRSIRDVFEFTINPQNTPLWIHSIQEEVSDAFPPKIGTQYKNRGKKSGWDSYRVIEYKLNNIFTLSDLDKNYHVRYSFRKLSNNQTEMEYFEWMKEGELKKPFTQNTLDRLKFVMERRQF